MKHIIICAALSFGLWTTACGTTNTNSDTDDTAPGQTASPQADIGDGDGLNVEYFDHQDFTGPSLKRIIETVNFDWANGAPTTDLQPDTFSARFTGELNAPTTGTYTLYATADDGVRLSINSQEVINDFTDHAPRTTRAKVNLVAGQRVPLKLEYFESYGGASLKLEWRGPGVSRRVIPKTRLYASAVVSPPPSPTPPSPTTPPAPPAPTPPSPTPPSPTPPTPTGNTFYVAPNGNDANAGSEAQPWATINHAAQTLQPGDTVLVKNGTYGGVYVDRSGAPGKPITFKAFPGDKPRIEIKVINSPGFLLEGASYINIDGFDLDYTYPITDAEKANGERWEGGITIKFGGQGAQATPVHHVSVTNNRVHGFPGGGIGSGLADYITIEGNAIWETALWSNYDTSAISLYQNANTDFNADFHNIIRGNTVFNNENKVIGSGIKNTVITDGNCIIIDDGRLTQNFSLDNTKFTAYKGSTLIENNICAGNGARGVEVYSSDNVLVRHNTFYKNLQTKDILDKDHPNTRIGGGELDANAASNVRFVNNIVYAEAGLPVTGTYDVTNVVFENNLYFGTTNIPDKSSSDKVGDPLFENPSTDLNTANFRLKSGSPAIDAALTRNSPATDVGGLPRPVGAGSDIGAWEWR
jgi:parallel beta-helix repeat protein